MPIVAGYALTERLGRGTYGEVFKAFHQKTRAVVAVKRILKKSLTVRAQDNLVDEIGILKNLKHRNIVQLIDFSWDSSYVYMFMEYLAGGDLSKFLKSQRRLPERTIRYFLQQLAFALHYLYNRNIVHMDIKPQNILLTPTKPRTLKLTDFGFAQSLESSTKMNEIRGSLLYMAPEIYQFGVYEKSCDLWSVGAILYEFLFGMAPFVSSTVEELKAKIVSTDPIEIPKTPKYSAECIDLVSKMLKRNPKDRIQHEAFFVHPFIDLPHAPGPKSVDKAIVCFTNVEELQEQGNLVDAFLNCKEGLQHLVAAAQYESDPARKIVIRTEIAKYLTLAESMRQTLDGISSPAVATSSSSLTSYEHPHFRAPIQPAFVEPLPTVSPTDLSNSQQPENPATQLPMHNKSRFKNTALSLSLFESLQKRIGSPGGSENSHPGTSDMDSGSTPAIMTPNEYALIRLDALDDLVPELTSSLAKVVKEIRTFYFKLNNNEFQSAMDYIKSEFSFWLDVVKNDSNKDRQKQFKTELNDALSAAEKIKASLKTKALGEDVVLGEEAIDLSTEKDGGQSCMIS